MFTEIKIMSNTNKFIKKSILLTFVIVVGCILLAPPTAYADAAGDACKKEKSGQPRNACKEGFNLAYQDPNKKKSDICDKYKDKKNNRSCVNGVKAGREKKDADDRNSGNSGGGSSGLNGSGGYKDTCGKGDDAVKVKFDFKCQGSDYEGPVGAIGDMAFAFIRFLSIGVGVAVVISIIVAGIQYSASEGNPETTQRAKQRIQNAIIGLILYIFIFAIIQFLVPGGLFS